VSIQILPEQGPTRVLSFEGPYDRVEVPSSALLDLPQDFTIEAWVLIRTYQGGHGVFNRWVSTSGDIQLTFGAPEIVAAAELPAQEPVPSHTLATWLYVSAGIWITAYSSQLPSVAAWHHLASSYGGGALKLYVDGSLWATASGTETIPSPDGTAFIGATARSERPIDPGLGQQWWPPIDGWIAEVRISAMDRYPNDFVPERRLASDPATIALWHLDEGSGDMAMDSGPNRLNGAIVHAQWIPAPAR